MSNTLPFHQWLKRRRKALDLGAEELAQAAGCSPNTLRKLENGERRPSAQLAGRLADQLRIDPAHRAAFLAYARSGMTDARIPIALEQRAAQPPAPAEPPATARFDVPRPLTRLIGRDMLLGDLQRLLRDPAQRIVTLLGPAGVGKTRLSLELAASLRDAFRDGVVFVPLAALREPELVPQAILQALRVPNDATRPPEAQLQDELQRKQILLVLDNFEQLAHAGALISRVLGGCHGVTALVTSRVPLGVRGEQQVTLAPLALPDRSRPVSPAALTDVPAVALFVERVRQAVPGFSLSDANAPAVAEICARLDGLPLALELVAPRCKLMTPQALLERLARPQPSASLDLLAQQRSDLPPRHQSLRSALAWSYELLLPDDQALFTRLGCFADAWTLEAAEAVCGDQQRQAALLDGMQALVDANLVSVIRWNDDSTSFAMLETVREYAVERLERDGPARETRRRHAEFYCRFAEEAFEHLNGGEQRRWQALIEREQNNLRAAISWSLECGEAELAGRITAALARYWWRRGPLTEARQWLDRVLACGAVPERLRGRLLNALTFIAKEQGEYDVGRRAAEQALAICRATGDRKGEVTVLSNLANVMSSQGNDAAAEPYILESLAIAREIGDTWSVATCLNNLGNISMNAGDYAPARERFEQAGQAYRAVGDQHGVALSIGNLGALSIYQGDYPDALMHYKQSFAIRSGMNDRQGIASMLSAVTRVAVALGHPAAAARLLGAAATWRANLGMVVPASLQQEDVKTLAMIRERLALKAVEQHMAFGREMTLEQVVSFVVDELEA